MNTKTKAVIGLATGLGLAVATQGDAIAALQPPQQNQLLLKLKRQYYANNPAAYINLVRKASKYPNLLRNLKTLDPSFLQKYKAQPAPRPRPSSGGFPGYNAPAGFRYGLIKRSNLG